MKSKLLKKSNIIIISGPTATGKSDLAIKIASIINGEIINADSMQVYKYFNILTSQPSHSQKKKIKHHLYSYIEPKVKMSAARWLKDIRIPIEKIFKKGKIPIVVGGSGLYLEFLINGISQIPSIKKKSRAKVENNIKKYGLKEMYNKLVTIDPVYALKINPTDKQRIVRSLEVYEQTKKKFSHFHVQHKVKLSYTSFKILIMLDRKIIRNNCSERFKKMIQAGLVKEVQKYEKYAKNSRISKAIGYQEILSYLKKEISLEEAQEIAINKTRKYAKRQSTWFKNRYNADFTIKSVDDISLLLESLFKII